MKQLTIILLGLIGIAYGQSAPTSAKTRFVNGLYVGTKLDTYFAAADSNAIYWRADSALMAKYKGTARRVAFTTNVDSVRDKRVHIKDFAVDPTGATDSRNAIQAALDTAKARGVAIVFDNGTYLVNSALNISGYSKQIIGYNTTVFSNSAIKIFNLTNADSLTISGIEFKGNTSSLQYGIYVNSAKRLTIQNCYFSALDTAINFVYSNLDTSYTVIDRLEATSNIINNSFVYNNTGFYALIDAEYLNVSNNIFNNNKDYGLVITGGNIRISNNTINNNGIGVWVDGRTSLNSDHGSIIGNTINHNLKAGILATNLRYQELITGNQIWANLGNSASSGDLLTYGASFGIFLKGCANGVNVSGNTIAHNEVGVGLDSTNALLIGQNDFLANASFTTHHIKEYGSTASTTNVFGFNTFGAISIGTPQNIEQLSGSTYKLKYNNGTLAVADTIYSPRLRALSSAGISVYSDNGTLVALMGSGGGAGTTLYGGLIGTTISTSGNITSSARLISNGGSLRSYTDGSNTQGAGANFMLSNAAETRFWFQQLNASNGIDWHYFGGSGYTLPLTLSTNGNLTALGGFIKSGGTSTQSLMADGSVQTLTSGTYTPTLTNTTNISSSSLSFASYTRIGNTVTAYATASATPTANGSCELTFTLPISSTTPNVTLTGSGIDSAPLRYAVTRGGGSGTSVGATFTGTAGAAHTIYITFQYQVN